MADDKIKIEQDVESEKLSQKTQRGGRIETMGEPKEEGKAAPAKPKTEEEHLAQIGQAFESSPVDLSKTPPPATTSAAPTSQDEAPSPEEEAEAEPEGETPLPGQAQPQEDQAKEKSGEEKPEEKKPEEEAKKKKEEEEKPKEPEEGAPKEGAAPEEAAAEEGAIPEAGEGLEKEGLQGAKAGAKGTTGLGEGAAAGEAGAEAGAAGVEAAGAAGTAGAAGEAGAAAAAAGAETAAAAGAGATIEFWGPIAAVGCAIIILLIVATGAAAYTYRGYLAKTPPRLTGKNAANVNQLVKATTQSTDVRGYNSMSFDPKDVQYLNDGIIDTRLVDSLNYLASIHKYLKVSHILTAYEDMTVNPEADQLSSNISAHHNGLAADIVTIDFVYKVFENNYTCSSATGGAVGDIVYYNDENKELLRLTCRGDLFDQLSINTIWNGKPATAIPIDIPYQDAKPDNPHAGNLPDPGVGLVGVEKSVYDNVMQPEARRKIHQIIAELLEFPGTTDDPESYRVTQLITFSYPRDVKPFIDAGTLDKVYGTYRPANYGLFAMEEAWQNVHIGY